MSQKIFISGSSDGLGLLAAKALASRGHAVYLHARNAKRANDAESACPDAKGTLTADLSSLEETKKLAKDLNRIGPFDAIIHNAGVMHGVQGTKGTDGFATLFAVNIMAPYVLACLVDPLPKRLLFLSSSMHFSGQPRLNNLQASGYGDSKLHNIMLANAFARKYGKLGVVSNALDPGWVQTKMGGSSAPDDIGLSVDAYVMLALGEGGAKGVTGQYWSQCDMKDCRREGIDVKLQDGLLTELEKLSGVAVPEK